MVFDGDDSASALFGVVNDEFRVDGFYGEGIEDTNSNAFSAHDIGSLQTFVERHTGADNQHLEEREKVLIDIIA